MNESARNARSPIIRGCPWAALGIGKRCVAAWLPVLNALVRER
jgi:hypothetical protein